MAFVSIEQKRLLTSIPLAAPNSLVASTFSGPPTSATMTLASVEGLLFVFTSVQLDRFHQALEAGDMEGLQAAQGAIERSVVEVDCEVAGAVHLPCISDSAGVLLITEHGILRPGLLGEQDDLLPTEALQNKPKKVRGEKFIKSLHSLTGCAQVVRSEADPTCMYCLDCSGQLHLICPLTLVLLHTWEKQGIEDFVLLEDEGSSETRLLVLVNEQGQTEETKSLQILALPSLSVCYRLTVSWYCQLVQAPLNPDSPLLVEGASDDVLRPDLVTRLRLRGISEGVPEARLQRLIKRAKFTDALSFAQTFNLEPEPVFMAQAASLVTRLSPWKLEGKQEEDCDSLLKELMTCLGRMNNLDYIIETCVTAALPTIKATRKLLLFARSVIEANVTRVKEDLRLKVSFALHRLETFTLLTSGTLATIEPWLEFCRAEVLDLVESALTQGDVTKALLLWTRHMVECSKGLTLERALAALDKLPESQDMPSMLSWLAQFLPDLLSIMPSSLPHLADWAIKATRQLELSRRKEWPEVLQFCTLLFFNFSTGGCHSC